jgi:hypothetical protein
MSQHYPRRRLDVTTQTIGGETLIYDGNHEAIHTLNATAQLIWHLCDGEHDAAAMAQILRQKFAISPQQNVDVAGDVQRVLAEFAAKGLLQT